MDTEAKTKNPPNDPNRPETETTPIVTRPHASSGWWLGCLLAIAYTISYWTHKRSSSFEYKLSTIVAFGLTLETIAIYLGLSAKSKQFKWILSIVATILTSSTIYYCLDQGIIFSLFSGFTTTFVYHVLYFFVLRRLPKSFTYGEASIVVQGFVIFAYNIFLKFVSLLDRIQCSTESDVCNASTNELHGFWISNMHKQMSVFSKLATILQVGLLGVTIIVACCYLIRFLRGVAFYLLVAIIGTAVVLFPIDEQFAVTVLVEFLTKDLQKLCIIVLYVGLIGLTVSAVAWQINRNQQSNTRTRKIFHLLIVFVYLPSLIYQCNFLFLSSGIALAVFVVMETIRVIELPPLYSILDKSIKSFIDEKDAGRIAMTPIYLLVGCSLPLWIHPCPCDLTDSAVFEFLPLLGGVISVGFGDTAASIVGSKFGRIPWPYCTKTIEGTLAGILVQAAVLPFLIYFGLVRYTVNLTVRYLVAITVSSLVETFTDQVDNLVLPLVTYILLLV